MVTVEERTREHVRIADNGKRNIFRFCPQCGSTDQLEDFPDLVAVTIGSFADPALRRRNFRFTSRENVRGATYGRIRPPNLPM
jgi:hypothetical protein